MNSIDQRYGSWCVSVHPGQINYYYDNFYQVHRSNIGFTSDENSSELSELSIQDHSTMGQKLPEQFKNNSHNGKISKSAFTKISRAIDYLLFMAKPKRLPDTKHGKGLFFKVNFVTLTLSSKQIHSDEQIAIHCFRPFLNTLRKRYPHINYIWRAERQSSGGIHYHIVTDRFIHWNELRNLWNKCQQNLGYVTRYREAQLAWHSDGFHYRPAHPKNWGRERQFKAYEYGMQTGWDNPNSTDVHALKHIKNLQAYFKKYMTKEGQNSDISGRLWGCSSKLSGLKGGRAYCSGDIDSELKIIESLPNVHVFKSDFFVVIYILAVLLKQYGCFKLYDLLQQYCQEHFCDNSPPCRSAA